jgi:hypothetical protein
MSCLGFNPLQIPYYNTKSNPNKTKKLSYAIVLQGYTHIRPGFRSYRPFSRANTARCACLNQRVRGSSPCAPTIKINGLH